LGVLKDGKGEARVNLICIDQVSVKHTIGGSSLHVFGQLEDLLDTLFVPKVAEVQTAN